MVNTRNFYFGTTIWASTILVTGGVYILVEILKFLQKTTEPDENETGDREPI